MATVYLVHDSMLGVNRAVKVLNRELETRANIQRRFAREARTMAQIRHANVVTVFDVIQTGAVSAIVMDFVEGGSLYDLLEQRGMLETEEALAVMHEVAAGVEAAHSFGVIHRDIKPHNILLETSGVPKLSDFGIARHLEQSHGFTRTGAVLGTMAFMAPEQRGGLDSIDLRADVYAMGATLYVLVTGRTPFDLYAKEFHQRLFEGVPAVVAAIVKKACSFRPEERHDSARDFAAHIRAVLDADVDVLELLPKPDPLPLSERPHGLTTSYDPTFDFDSLDDDGEGRNVVQLGPGAGGASVGDSEGGAWWEDSVAEPVAAAAATPAPPARAAAPTPPPAGSAAAVLAALPAAPDTVADETAGSASSQPSPSRSRMLLAPLALAPVMAGGLWWALSGGTDPAAPSGNAAPAELRPEPASEPSAVNAAPAPVQPAPPAAAPAAPAPAAEEAPPEAAPAAPAPAAAAVPKPPPRPTPPKKRPAKPAPAPPAAAAPSPEPAPETVRMGTVVINAVPAGQYSVAGRSGKTPELGLELPEGSHTVRFVHPDGSEGSTTVRVRADDTARVCWSFADASPCAF